MVNGGDGGTDPGGLLGQVYVRIQIISYSELDKKPEESKTPGL
jgi:hypothetical protein